MRPITLRKAQSFVDDMHRHNKAPRGHKFSLGLFDNARMVGCAVVGRPIARALDNGLNAEVCRTCTDGTANANSMLYGAALRACKAMGYHKVYTYTQAGESGASLRAVGFVVDAVLPPRGSWAQSSLKLQHKRDQNYDTGGVERTRWVVVFGGNA